MKLLLSLLCIAVPLSLAQAQKGQTGGQSGKQQQTQTPQTQTPQTPPPPPPIWKCTLPGGTYEVAVPSITAISTHQYLVDATVQVTEVNVDTNGPMVVRFYYIQPNLPTSGPAGAAAATVQQVQGLLTQGSSAAGADAWQKVVKNYPLTTHAHTVEFRVGTVGELQAIFSSVETAFNTGAAGQYSGSQ
jgi:hypothetical protein